MSTTSDSRIFGDAETALCEVRQATKFLKAVVANCGGELATVHAADEVVSSSDRDEAGLIRGVSGLELLARALWQLDAAELELKQICDNARSIAREAAE